MIAFSKIKALAMNLNSGILLKRLPPRAVKNSAGKVLIPKTIIAIAAKKGL